MEVEFGKKKLEKFYRESAKAARAYGEQVARKYILRINTIKAAQNLDELFTLPGLKCHPLKGNRKGQFAISLTGFYRLIFKMKGDKLDIVSIEEVSKHYDD